MSKFDALAAPSCAAQLAGLTRLLKISTAGDRDLA